MKIGVEVVVLQDERVLLIKRRDFELWALPSGGVEIGESLSQTAVREVKEETGLDVALTGLLGVLSLPGIAKGFADHLVLFTAKVIGGELQTITDETLDAGFFAGDELPELIPTYRVWIEDALAGHSGIVRVQPMGGLHSELTRKEMMENLRKSDLSPAEYFMQHILMPTEPRVELGKTDH